MSSATASNMAPPKATNDVWAILFKTVYESGLLSGVACDILGLSQTGSPYHKNNHFQVPDITLKKLKALDYEKFPNLSVDMILTMLNMLGPSAYEPDQSQRKRWANQFTQFLQSMVVRLPGKAVMGGTLNDLLMMYFEKLTRKFTSKKALSGPEGSARVYAIRVACGCPEEVKAEEVKAEEVVEVVVEEEVVVIQPEEVPDNWDDE
jgi:hypothetical protein